MLTTHLRRYPADFFSPTLLFEQLRRSKGRAFFVDTEMGLGLERRYTCVGGEALASWELRSDRLRLRMPGGEERTESLERGEQLRTWLRAFVSGLGLNARPEGLPPSLPVQGLWGFLGFDACRYRYPELFEGRGDDGDSPAARLPLGDYVLFRYELVLDHTEGCWYALIHCSPGEQPDWVWLESLPEQPRPAALPFVQNAPAESLIDDADWKELQKALMAEWKRGAAWSVRAVRALQAPCSGDAWAVFRGQNAAAKHRFFWQGADFQLWCQGEEQHIYAQGQQVQITKDWTRTERGEDDAGDRKRLYAQLQTKSMPLLEDACRDELAWGKELPAYSLRRQVHYDRRHLLLRSRWQATRSGRNSVDWFLACFPALSSCGISRRQALSLLLRYEPQGRGPCGGSWGFLGSQGLLQKLPLHQVQALKDQKLLSWSWAY